MLAGGGGVPPGGHQFAGGSGGPGTRVKVEDALSYLDQVKTQFMNEPAVYTQFLDIMKDFKSQVIDTPGVITRVSRLFRGRPNLITGFNTFLPPGFEVQVGAQGRITIMEPSGRVQVISEGDMEEEAKEDEPMEEEEEKKDPTPAPAEESSSEPPANSGQEFNHAIGYVNKIKIRFSDQPIVYKHFLEILHEYQSQIQLNNGAACEKYVLGAIAKLFKDEPDLLSEFKNFLPDIHGNQREAPAAQLQQEEEEDESDEDEEEDSHTESPKRSSPIKRVEREVWRRGTEMRDAAAVTTVEDIQLFDRLRRALSRSQHETLLRLMNLYTTSLISANDLLTVAKSSLEGHPQLLNELRDLLYSADEGEKTTGGEKERGSDSPEGRQGVSSELAHQIDYASCRLLGVSYRSLPDSYQRPVCSGRTPLCYEVLNDTWVSFPSWSSEDSSSVTSKKTVHEEFIYRTEDERFELDIIIEVNKYAIEALEGVKKKMASMRASEADKFRLDERLGGGSPSLMLRAVKRIYGEHASKMIEGLKKNPQLAVTKVLDRLHEKDAEWREAQQEMNRVWRDQNEKHMTRSLCHQALAVKNADAKLIKVKTLIHNIEQMFDERQQRCEDGLEPDEGPHVIWRYPKERSVLRDTADIMIHFIKRQSNYGKEEKRQMKKALRRFVPDLFLQQAEPMSDAEDEDEEEKASWEGRQHDERKNKHDSVTTRYRLMYGGNSLFAFLRIHNIICSRLGTMRAKWEEQVKEWQADCEIAARQKEIYTRFGKEPVSHELNASDVNHGLHLLKTPRCSPERNYSRLIEEIKNLLDGQVEPTAYEDNIRVMFPTLCYLVSTMDKLIPVAARQLAGVVSDCDRIEAIPLYKMYRVDPAPGVMDRGGANEKRELEYAAKAEQLLNRENCFKVTVVDSLEPVVGVQLVDTETGDDDDMEEEKERARQLHAKVESAVEESEGPEGGDTETEEGRDKVHKSRTFLARNLRMRNKNMVNETTFFASESAHIHASTSQSNRHARCSIEVLLRKRPKGYHKTRMEQLERINEKRNKRARLMREGLGEDGGAWTKLAEGTIKTLVRHPKFKHIVFNRFVIKPSK